MPSSQPTCSGKAGGAASGNRVEDGLLLEGKTTKLFGAKELNPHLYGTVKTNQSLGNKMEAQINRLEAQAKKLQQMYNTGLEELRNRQSTMNNTITEIKKYTRGNKWAERTNRRLSEAEER